MQKKEKRFFFSLHRFFIGENHRGDPEASRLGVQSLVILTEYVKHPIIFDGVLLFTIIS